MVDLDFATRQKLIDYETYGEIIDQMVPTQNKPTVSRSTQIDSEGHDNIMDTQTETHLKEIRNRLQARGAYPAVPDEWLGHLAELDERLAQIDPTYQVDQIKTKWGTLRYYISDPGANPCCVALLELGEAISEETFTTHTETEECKDTRDVVWELYEQKQKIVDEYEYNSANW